MAARAQVSNPYDLPQYSFIKYNENTFKTPGDSIIFAPFFRKIDTLLIRGTGKINIVHFGGSHLQADIYTHRVRERMQLMGQGVNGGRGLLFPFDIAHTNNPGNYKVFYEGPWQNCKNINNKTCNLGLTGISVTTFDTLSWFSIGLNARTNVNFNTDRIKIFYLNDSNSFDPVLRTTAQIIDTIDNVELGYREFVLDTFVDQITVEIVKTRMEQQRFTLFGVYFDNSGPGIVYNAVGVNGARLESYLQCNYLVPQLKTLSPDLIVISIGTNDAYTRHFDKAKFESEYTRLIQLFRKAAPSAQLLLTVPNDSYLYKRYNNKNTAVQQEIIYRLSERYNCGVWDFYALMGGLNSAMAWYYSNLMKYDRIHFNHEGYLFKGDLFFNAFLNAYDNYLDTKGNSNSFN